MNISLIKILDIHFVFAEANSCISLPSLPSGDHKVSTRGMRLPKAVKTRDQFSQNSCVFVDKLNSLFLKIN